jgi:hypothetical protein
MKSPRPAVRVGIVVALGIGVIGFTVWRTYPHATKKVSLLDPNLKFMHCPECETEARFDIADVEKPCRQCGYELGLVPTVDSIKLQSARSPYGKMVAFLVPEILVFLAALWYVLKPPPVTVENYRYMRCSHCGQKLRYRAVQIGALGACSRCKKPLRFPEGTANEKVLDGAAPEELSAEEGE